VTRIGVIQQVRAVRPAGTADVRLSWVADSEADGYNTWVVTVKEAIPQARSGGPGTGVPGCLDRGPADCVHTAAVSPVAGTHLYYNVVGVCGGIEAAE